MHRDIKVILINANSICSISKRAILYNFIQQNNPDIVLVTETKLSPRFKVNFNNYNIVRTDRVINPNNKNPGGGTCIFIKETYKYSTINLPKFNSIEVSGIKLQLQNNSSINFFSIYHSNKIAPHIDVNDLSLIVNISGNSPFIAGGDFNAKHTSWHNSNNCCNGNIIYNWFLQNSLNFNIDIIAPQQKTRKNSVLDFFIASTSLLNALSLPMVIPGTSDHEAVVLLIRNLPTLRDYPREILNFKQTNWREFNLTLDNKLQELQIPIDTNLTFEEINNFATKLQNILIETSELHVPKVRLKKSYQVVLDSLTLHLIQERKTFRRRLHRARNTSREPLLNSIIKNLDTIIRQKVYSCRRLQFEAKIKGIRRDNNMYKNVKSICGNININVPLIHNNLTINDNSNKANIIGEVFENNHKLTLNDGDNNFNNLINTDILNDFNNFNEPIVNFNFENSAYFTREDNVHGFVTPNSLKAMTKVKNSRKSPGLDNISFSTLQKLPSLFFLKLSILFNHAYNVGYFPKIWKHAIVAPIPKAGKPGHLPTSFRPISLLTSTSKLFERFIAGKLDRYTDDNGILPDFQFGFRHKHSTLAALNIFQNDILYGAYKKEPVVAVSLDIEKAFDTTWIEGIVYKLRNYGYPRTLCSIVYQFLTNRSFQVKIQGELSRTFNIPAGVPQGSVLGPKLFNIYTSDIPPSPPKVRQLCFADDFLTYTSSISSKIATRNLNSYLSTLLEYYHKWKIKINADKAVAIAFTGTLRNRPRRYSTVDIKLRLGNSSIPLLDSMKYLGVYFTPKMNFIEHVRKTIQNVQFRTKYLHNALRLNNLLDVNIKILSYKQLVRPLTSHAFPIWSCISSAQMEKLRCNERKILRRCINYTRKPNGKHYPIAYIYEKARTPRLDDHLMSIAHRYLDRQKDFANPLYQRSCNLDPELINALRIKPAQYLDKFRDTANIAIPLYNRGFYNPEHRVYK